MRGSIWLSQYCLILSDNLSALSGLVSASLAQHLLNSALGEDAKLGKFCQSFITKIMSTGWFTSLLRNSLSLSSLTPPLRKVIALTLCVCEFRFSSTELNFVCHGIFKFPRNGSFGGQR